MKILTLVPARGGSKGVPGKNIKALGGKPLIAHTIEAAIGAGLSPIVTTDDEAIAAASREAGAVVPGLRPSHLATDEATSFDVAMHALKAWVEREDREPPVALCLLQPTSPFRTAAHLGAALELFHGRGDAPGVVSVCPVEKPPRWMYHMHGSGKLEPCMTGGEALTRRQDAAPLHVLNGAIYIVEIEALRETKSFVPPGTLGYGMSAEDSIDIDSPLDWVIAEALWAHRHDASTHASHTQGAHDGTH